MLVDFRWIAQVSASLIARKRVWDAVEGERKMAFRSDRSPYLKWFRQFMDTLFLLVFLEPC